MVIAQNKTSNNKFNGKYFFSIYLNTVRGGTPSASPLDSPAEQPSIATVDSPSRLQVRPDSFLPKLEESLIESTPPPTTRHPKPHKKVPRELLETPIDAALLESSPRTFKEARQRILDSKRRFLESDSAESSPARRPSTTAVDAVQAVKLKNLANAVVVAATVETPKRSASGDVSHEVRRPAAHLPSSVSVEAVKKLADVVERVAADTPKKVSIRAVDVTSAKKKVELRKDSPKSTPTDPKKFAGVDSVKKIIKSPSGDASSKKQPEPVKKTEVKKSTSGESKKSFTFDVNKKPAPTSKVPPVKPPRKNPSVESTGSEKETEKENDDPLNVLLQDLFFPLQVTQTQLHASTSFDFKSTTNPLNSIFSELFTPKHPADRKQPPPPPSKSSLKPPSKKSTPVPSPSNKKPVKCSPDSKPLSSDLISESMKAAPNEIESKQLLNKDDDSDRESIASHKRLGGVQRHKEPP